ncbi:MAG: UDP-N-acetylmuramoyl-L-alanine--D-glutamate ligase [Chloroflexi bacterium]|nr:UDP-N-acetylmuramoyl-L-alanine--D-glutamate ligase [Chloroflexota bacterium]
MKDEWLGKRVVILGLARQGTALAQYLVSRGARVAVSDAKSEEQLADALAALSNLPIEYALGGHPPTLLNGADLLCLSGGVPAGVPLAQEARSRGVPVSNDSQIFLDAAPCRVVGITGSAGKTTTTTLTGKMIGASGRATWVGGNIGNPLIADLDRMAVGDIAVMELSSFQLEIMTTSPQVAGVLNITPNHLDRHGTMDVYIEAKSQILRHQPADAIAVLGRDDDNARALESVAPGQVWWFSAKEEVGVGAFIREGTVCLRDGQQERTVCAVSDIRLRGAHNVLNVLAASALAGAVGAAPEAMGEAIVNFAGVPHRLELVRELNGVKWYNDSIATAPERVVAALNSFAEPIVLLAGGRDKKLPWDEFARAARQRTKTVIAFGEAADLIERAAEVENEKVEGRAYKARPKLIRVVKRRRMADAVQKAAEIAEAGDVVLLSPGGTSFDEFKDFEERGQRFREMVSEL